MKTTLMLLALGAVVLLLTASRPRPPADPASIAEIEAYIGKLIARNRPPGLSIVVLKDGLPVYRRAFGWADGPNRQPAAPDTLYHWWSMTKVPTAVAILQLQDHGQLHIDDPVSQHLPFFQVQWKGEPAPPITIRQLLRHTSGLPDTIPAMIGWVHYEDQVYNQTELLKQHLPRYSQLKFAPDSDAAYSNLGYMVLGAIIEAVSGMPYETYIQEQILAPLEMVDTSFLYRQQSNGRAAAGSHPLFSVYTPLLPFLLDMDELVREREKAHFWFNPVYTDVTPSSGLIGSADEAALLAGALLSQDEILTTQGHHLLLPQGSSTVQRPLGWAEYNSDGRLWVQHSGGGPGFATVMRLYPEESLGIVIMANSTDLPREDLVEALASIHW